MSGPRDHLPTERPNARTEDLDALPVEDALARLADEDEHAVAAVRAAHAELAQAISLVSERLAGGGRLFYVGAGTSGRLGVLDAAECPPTFSTPESLVQGVIAGGPAALTRAVEGAEDDPAAGAEDLAARGVGPADCVVGISAGGTTPYVHGALAHARAAGAATVFLACVPFDVAPDEADLSIRLDTGPEPITGSTRMKAGTATKLALNALSTLTMVRLGKVHGNRMVDLAARGNAKLVERAISLVSELAEVDRASARVLLEEADWRVKTAVVMRLRACTSEEAERLLDASAGRLRDALDRGSARPR